MLCCTSIIIASVVLFILTWDLLKKFLPSSLSYSLPYIILYLYIGIISAISLPFHIIYDRKDCRGAQFTLILLSVAMWMSTVQYTVTAVISILALKWLDKRFFKSQISFQLPFLILYGYTLFISLLVLPFWAFYQRGDCDNSKRTCIVLRQISRFLGVKWELRGRELLEAPEGCIVVVNHQSSLDILALFWLWRYFNRMAPVAKKELFYVWPFGLAAYFAGVVFVDRANSLKARKQLEDASRMMHRDGTKLLLFPEGTRNTKRSITEFKRGAFHMAVTCQVPILPLVISPYFFINPAKKFFGSGRVVIEALPMVSTAGLSVDDVPALTNKVRGIMSERYQLLDTELRAQYPPDYPGLY